MCFPALLIISLLWKIGRKKNKGEPEQLRRNGWGSRCQGLGDGLCSCVALSSAFTLILSFCPVLIFSLIFFSFITSSFSSILSFCLSLVFFLCSPLRLSLFFPFAFMLVGVHPTLAPFPHISSPPIPSQKHSKLISISGSLGCLLQRDEPACCSSETNWNLHQV